MKNSKYFTVNYFSILVLLSLSILLVLCFNYFSVSNILLKIYKWHLVQPESVQGGLELIILFIIMILLIMSKASNRGKSFIILLLALIYLKLHQVLIPTITVFLYFEVILAFGRYILSRNKNYDFNEAGFRQHFDAFLVGISSWCLIALIFSGLSMGSFSDLRLLTFVIGIFCLFNLKGNLFFIDILKKFNNARKIEKFGFSYLLILILTQLAKSNTAIDYDSAWYGLRPELVLIGENSFFDNLGLTMFVHYYSKLYEFILIPISNLGDYSFILNSTTFMLLFLFTIIYSFFISLKVGSREAILMTCAIGSIPAITNMGSSAKTDIFFTVLFLLVAYYLWNWINSKNNVYFIFAIIGTLLCLHSKVTSFLYIPLLYSGLILIVFIYKYSVKDIFAIQRKELIELNFYMKLLVTTFIVFIGFCYRTYSLTGYPFYPFLGKVWNIIGFQVKYPFLENPQNILLTNTYSLKEVIQKWYNVWFNPGDYPLHVSVWPGNLTLFLFILFLILLIFKPKIAALHSKLLIFCIPLLLSRIYLVTITENGGDGNYYIPTMVLLSIGFVYAIFKIVNPKIKMFILVCILMFIPFQSTIMFVTHFSWSWGTSAFSYDLTKTDFETNSSKEIKFNIEGMKEINEYIKNNKEIVNCLGDGVEQTLNQLSCRFENIANLGSRYGNHNIVDNAENFIEYLNWANVRYLILPYENTGYAEHNGSQRVINIIKEIQTVKKIEDGRYYLLDLKNVDLDLVTRELANSQ
ncbi:hypothetical protein WAX74_04120 [Psychrobacillus sp. FJAT-51614]|uniref:Glycosyltransferase RgtA/B/C/D-like domain-containing protein n=1 Tax=Psychrobacillus mangrovi TaxID=3117745 RepID=A0ABU8F1F2_9BACI